MYSTPKTKGRRITPPSSHQVISSELKGSPKENQKVVIRCRVKVVCNRCGKSGHIKANCHVKLDKAGANVAHESKESEQSN